MASSASARARREGRRARSRRGVVARLARGLIILPLPAATVRCPFPSLYIRPSESRLAPKSGARRLSLGRSAHAPRWVGLPPWRSGRVPPYLDDVTIRVAELDAHIVRL